MDDIPKLIGEMGPTVIIVVGSVLGAMMVFATLAKRLLYVCPPNMVIIFSGRKHVRDDGREVGFRTIFGGRAWRMPIVEQAQSMDLSNISVPMGVSGAYSEGTDGALGIPLTLHAVANVKVSSDRRYIGNAIERFLGAVARRLPAWPRRPWKGTCAVFWPR